jgi:hypothetical protein
MLVFGKILSLLILATALTLAGCSSDGESGKNKACTGKCDDLNSGTGFNHQWAIDMQKVRGISKYANSPRFVAAVQQELQMPDELWQMNCKTEKIIVSQNPDGSATTQDGGCFVWGNMMTRNPDHSLHVDDPEKYAIINIIDGDKKIDPPGYLNIIALKNSERHMQDEVRAYLQNGDILVYFHPEDHDTTQFRMHHAAMFYDTGEGPLAINVGGVPYVHHIDNPVSYGPALNAGADSVPFHVYRFSPNGAANVGPRDADGKFPFPCNDEIRGAGGPAACQAGEDFFTITDDMAAHYAYMARNWALLTNDHAPFASFHTMTWRDAYKRNRDGVTVLEDVDRWAKPAIERGQTPEVYCAGLVYSNLNLALNRPMNQTAMGSELWSLFTANSYDFDDYYMSYGDGRNNDLLSHTDLIDTENLPSFGQLVFEPIPASAIIDAWLEGYFGQLPREAQAQILMGAAEQLASGFSQLEWAAEKDADMSNNAVATPERIIAYAQAYGAGGDTLAQMKQDELQHVDNRYVPPPLYHWIAQQEDSPLAYVGTVIPVDLLSPLDGNSGDTGSGEISEFAEGGPDTSLYTHYYIENGGRHVQRLLAVSAGPQRVGVGSKMSTRISAADINDVRVILHPAGSFDFAAMGSDRYACEENPDCIGNVPGIMVPVSAAQNDGNTVWHDVKVEFEFFKPVSEGGLGCLHVEEEYGGHTCPLYDWATGEVNPERIFELDQAHGAWTITVLDLGNLTEGQEIENCEQCANGGAHSNQWFILIRNDDPNDDPNPDPSDPFTNVYSYEGDPVEIPDTLNDAPACGGPALADNDFARADIHVSDDFIITGFKIDIEILHDYGPDLYVFLEHDGVKVADLFICYDFPDDPNVFFQGEDGEDLIFNGKKLDHLSGVSAEGTWTLVVGDYIGGDTGKINSFSITLSHE